MRRFRVTLLVVCGFIIYLGYSKISFVINNPEPELVSINKLLSAEQNDREWITVTDGTLLLKEVISSNGEMEPEALLIPLVVGEEDSVFKVFYETRDPKIMKTFKKYFFGMETEEEQVKYFNENIDRFIIKTPITGVLMTGSELKYNREKLIEIADITNTKVSDNVIFIQEKGEMTFVDNYGGYFLILIGILGLLKVIYLWFSERNIKKTACDSESGSCCCDDNTENKDGGDSSDRNCSGSSDESEDKECCNCGDDAEKDCCSEDKK